MNAAEVSMWLESLDNRVKNADETMGEVRNEMISIGSKLRPLIEELVRLEDETVFCTTCEARITGLSNALRARWSCLIDDEGNERGNFAGHYGPCTDRIEDESSPVGMPTEPSSKRKTSLFD